MLLTICTKKHVPCDIATVSGDTQQHLYGSAINNHFELSAHISLPAVQQLHQGQMAGERVEEGEVEEEGVAEATAHIPVRTQAMLRPRFQFQMRISILKMDYQSLTKIRSRRYDILVLFKFQ